MNKTWLIVGAAAIVLYFLFSKSSSAAVPGQIGMGLNPAATNNTMALGLGALEGLFSGVTSMAASSYNSSTGTTTPGSTTTAQSAGYFGGTTSTGLGANPGSASWASALSASEIAGNTPGTGGSIFQNAGPSITLAPSNNLPPAITASDLGTLPSSTSLFGPDSVGYLAPPPTLVSLGDTSAFDNSDFL